MNDKELERRLEQALSHAAPNDLEGILARCETQKGNVIPMTEKNSSKSTGKKRWAPLAVAACLALVLVGGGAGYFHQLNNAVTSVVSLDVNPSVELKVNKNEKVVSATPQNDDGTVILEGLDLKGVPVDVALNAVIGSLLQHGYVDELANSILITVEDEDVQRGEKLQQELTAQVDAVLTNAQINGAILSQTLQYNQDLSQKAEEYGISAGKAALIQSIVEGSNNTKTFESLVGLTINELNLLYSAQNGTDTQSQEGSAVIGGADAPTGIQVSNNIQTSGTASQSAYIGAEAAKSAALQHAGLSSDQVTFLRAEYDYDDGRMIYEVEFHFSSQKYEYEIDASNGQVVKYETESTGSASAGSGTSSSSYIGESAAKAAALSHAGVKESDTSYCNAWLEYDDGRAECYEVEFMVGSSRYEYEIALTSANVIKYEVKTYSQSASGGSGTGTGTGTGTSSGGSNQGGTSSGNTGNGGGTSSDIGREAAKNAALKDAGVSASDANFVKAERDWDDGRLEYEIEFWANNTEYDYTVDGATGAILKRDTEHHGTSGGGTGTSSDIGSDKAKSIALNHAGVSESDTYQLKVKQDYDDGRLEYEVEFKSNGKEYEYTILASDGTILSHESDWDD